ncbi:MAG: hypothetical protein PVSMB8_02970 [Vulcanimicrobiaceae bacterium]
MGKALGEWAKAWDEADHPRDDHGRFGAGGGGVSAHRATAESLEIREASPAEFHKAFAAAFANSDFKAFVTHYTEKELGEMKLFLSKDGKAGVAVHDHKDGRVEGTALFNTGTTKGAGLAMLAHACVVAKVNYVECYGPRLNASYATLGFKEHERFPFDPKQAAQGWNEKKFGRPDYITMKR